MFVVYNEELIRIYNGMPVDDFEQQSSVGIRFLSVVILFFLMLVLSVPLLLWFVFWCISLSLHQLNKAPNGMVGSIGLLLATVGFLM